MDREAVLAQPLQSLPVRTHGQSVGDPDLVAPQRQRPVGGQLGIELTDRSRGRVARVHEGGEAGGGASFVEGGEVGQRHVHLTPDLEQGRRCVQIQAQGNGADRAQVVGHVLPHLPVTARGAPLEHAVAVEQGDGQPVDLRLGYELELG